MASTSHDVAAAGTEHLQVAANGMAAYRAPSLSQPHKARQAIRDAYEGKIAPLIGFFFAFPTVLTARVIAQIHADWVFIDWEHSSCGVETMTDVVHAIQYVSEGRTIPFVRLPNHDHGNIAFALDAGASLIVPQVDTVEQARHIVTATKHALRAPCRWLPGSNADMTLDSSRSLWENLNDQAALVIQAESERGVRNLDAILSAVGDDIDAVFLGVLDLRISMGLDGLWGSEPEFLDVVRLYEETLHKHNKPTAGPCLDGNWRRGANKTMTVVTGDFVALLSQRAVLSGARENLPASNKAETWGSTDV
ncbi:HpcH/HpaI aldolase/citrate lyase family protein [Apiospora kogelbergensis]|uniref:HpcH/HpaI aldolase/citrate lyase family protein n=1 Tax=Apiospora kogelbergensis TaxID=1337665 RepID=UPI00313031A6